MTADSPSEQTFDVIRVTRLAAVVGLGLLPAVLGILHGGYFPVVWMGMALIVGAVVLMIRLGGGPDFPAFRGRLPWRVAVPALLLLALAVWTLLSAIWAADHAAALQEGTRTLTYVLLFAAALGFIGTSSDARLLSAAFVLSTAVCAVVVITLVALSDDPASFFRAYKLNEPVGYYNANGTFFAMAAVLGIHLASRLSTNPYLRCVCFAAGVVLLQAVVMTQSRGAFWALIAGVLVYLLVTPGRPRSVLWWGVALILLALTFPRLNAMYGDLRHKDLELLAIHARGAAGGMALTILASLAFAGALAFTERRVHLRRIGVLVTRVLAAIVVVALAGLIVVRFPALRDPPRAVQDAWTQFKGSDTHKSKTDFRILDLGGSNRYELWQVAWRSFEAHPVLGVGADNYVIEWLRDRPIPEYVLQPHNLYLRFLSETGIPSLILFMGAVLWIGSGALVSAFRSHRHSRPLIGGLIATCSVFLVHAAGEWVWHVPAVGSAFFILLGTVAALYARGLEPEAGYGRPAGPLQAAAMEERPWYAKTEDDAESGLLRQPRPLTLVAVIAGVTILLALPQTVSIRFSDTAANMIESETQGELRTIRVAQLANPLSARPYVLEARALAKKSDIAGTDRAFRAAIDRNPASWETYMRWGDWLKSIGKDPRHAYQKALALDPLSPELKDRANTP